MSDQIVPKSPAEQRAEREGMRVVRCGPADGGGVVSGDVRCDDRGRPLGPPGGGPVTTEQDIATRRYSHYPIRDVETIAKRLEDLARRIRGIAEGFSDSKQQPDSVLGDLISAYVQYTGNNATYLENLVRDVEHLRAARAVTQ